MIWIGIKPNKETNEQLDAAAFRFSIPIEELKIAYNKFCNKEEFVFYYKNLIYAFDYYAEVNEPQPKAKEKPNHSWKSQTERSKFFK